MGFIKIEIRDSERDIGNMYRTKQKLDYHTRFLETIKSPVTKQKYDIDLKYYCKDIDVSDPNSLITTELLDSPTKTRELEDSLIDYISYLKKEKQYSYGTIHTRINAILHFYTINRVNVNRRYISKFLGKHITKGKDNAYSREQIAQMISTCNVRQKAIIFLLASTGMRVGALPPLKLSHLQRVNLDKQHLYKITVYDSEPEEYYTFCSFECAKAIDEYLEFRKRFGEILEPESPLIREEFDRISLHQARNPKHLAGHRFQEIIDSILVQSGVKQRRTRKEGENYRALLQPVKMCHGFRKFAITQMVKSKLEYNTREYLVGHRKSLGLDTHYDRTAVEDRLNEYLKVVDQLTINEENRLRIQIHEINKEKQILMANIDSKIHNQIQEALRKYGIKSDS